MVKRNYSPVIIFLSLFHMQLLPIERAAKKEKKREKTMDLGSDDDDDDDDDEEEEKDDDDEDDEDKSDGDMEEEDTVQTNIDEMDKFRLPGAEEAEKEGEGFSNDFLSLKAAHVAADWHSLLYKQ